MFPLKTTQTVSAHEQSPLSWGRPLLLLQGGDKYAEIKERNKKLMAEVIAKEEAGGGGGAGKAKSAGAAKKKAPTTRKKVGDLQAFVSFVAYVPLFFFSTIKPLRNTEREGSHRDRFFLFLILVLILII